MGQNEASIENRRFGKYLRTIREERRLSLDTVEEMSLSFRERVTKSHLSRIENGQAIPTFPRMFTLSQIYGVPVSSLAERFEVALIRDMSTVEVLGKSATELRAEAKSLRESGRYRDALQIYETLLESGDVATDLALNRITCLVHLARFVSVKEDCEDLLGNTQLSDEHRAMTLYYLAMSCYRLGKFIIAQMVLDEAKQKVQALPAEHVLHAHFAGIEGNVHALTGQFDAAVDAYRKSLKHFESLNNTFEACRFRLNLSEALIECGRFAEARMLLKKALDGSRREGFDRQQALALSSLGMLAYRDDNPKAAEAYFLQSNTVARPRDYFSVVFRNCFYLWKMAADQPDETGRRVNERTLRAYLSRVEDYLPEAEEYRRHLTGGKK